MKISHITVFASMILICSCTFNPEISAVEDSHVEARVDSNHAHSWSNIRSKEQALADYKSGEAIIYSSGDFMAVPVGLEQSKWRSVSHLKNKYLGPVIPSNIHHKASLYNHAVYEQLTN